MARVLAYMAHPDDAEILVGGILLRLKSVGWEVGIAPMTAGDCGSDSLSREEISRVRLAEAEAAAGFLGARYAWTGLNDLEVMFNGENVRRVVESMRTFAPDVVITHSPVDYMVDHEEASRLVRASAFAVAMPLYQTGSPAPTPPAARSLVESLRHALPWRVTSVDERPVSQRPAPPFTTSTLQQEASRKLGFTAKRTMALAQGLYEGQDVGNGGSTGLITYMRTDSTSVSTMAQHEAREYISGKYGKDYLPS